MTQEQWQCVWTLASRIRSLPEEEQAYALFESPEEPYVVDTAARILNLPTPTRGQPPTSTQSRISTAPLIPKVDAGRSSPLLARSVAGGFAAVVFTAGLAAWNWTNAREPLLQPIALPAGQGTKSDPAISPDGETVAYASGGHIHLLALTSGKAPRQFSTGTAVDYSPAWSPDGRTLAFARQTAQSGVSEIWIAPVEGGDGRRIASVPMPHPPSPFARKVLEWSPDGTHLVVTSQPEGRPGPMLALLGIASGKLRPLFAGGDSSDAHPAFSPDGRTLAFTRALSPIAASIAVVDLGPGHLPVTQPRLLRTGSIWSAHPAWTPDGRELIFSAGSARNATALARIPADGGASRPLLNVPAGSPVIAREANAAGVTPLVFLKESTTESIWRQNLTRGPDRIPHVLEPAVRIAAGASSPSLSPDGARLAYVARNEIWTSAADGSKPEKWTGMGCSDLGRPRWSPDGTKLAFAATCGTAAAAIHVVDSPGAPPRRVTGRTEPESGPVWDADSRSVYFTSAHRIWKDSTLLMQRNAEQPHLSSDGRNNLYYLSSIDGGVLGLWTTPAAYANRWYGTPLLRDVTMFALDRSNAIYYRSPSISTSPSVIVHTEASRRLATPLDLGVPLRGPFTVAPDGSAIFYDAEERSGELVKVNSW